MTATTNGPDIVPVPRKTTGRPALTSRASLLSAARSHGFRGLTVGKVTAARYVKYSTFYRHFSSIGALTAVLVDDVLGEVAIPNLPDDWRAQLELTGAALARVLREWSGMADALAALDDTPAWIATARRRCYTAMVNAGVTELDAATGFEAMLDVVTNPRRINAAPTDLAEMTTRRVRLVCDGIAVGAGEK